MNLEVDEKDKSKKIANNTVSILLIIGSFISALLVAQLQWAYNHNYSDIIIRVVYTVLSGSILGAIYLFLLVKISNKYIASSKSSLLRKISNIHLPLYLLYFYLFHIKVFNISLNKYLLLLVLVAIPVMCLITFKEIYEDNRRKSMEYGSFRDWIVKYISDENYEIRRQRIIIIFLFILFLLAHAGLRILTVHDTPDTATYIKLQGISILNQEWWSSALSGRAIGVPVLYWLFNDIKIIPIMQKLISFISWTVLGLCISSFFRQRKIKVLITMVFLLGAFGRSVLFWNHILLSESLNTPFLILWVSYILRMDMFFKLHGKSRKTVFITGFIIITGFFITIRDTNTFIALSVIPYLLYYFHKRKKIITGILFSLIVGVISVSQIFYAIKVDFNSRGKLPLVNVIGSHVLTDAGRLRFFIEHGMPVNPEIMSLRGFILQDMCVGDISELGEWVDKAGVKVYLKFLINNIGYVVTEPFKYFDQIMNPAFFDCCSRKMQRNWLYKIYDRYFLLPKTYFRIELILLILFSVIYFMINKKLFSNYRIGMFSLALLFMGIVGGLISFLCDSVDIDRHGLITSIIIKLSIKILIVFQLAGILEKYLNIKIISDKEYFQENINSIKHIRNFIIGSFILAALFAGGLYCVAKDENIIIRRQKEISLKGVLYSMYHIKYEAENLFTDYGNSVISDPQASKGKARAGRPEFLKGNCIIYGPYMDLAAGKYKVSYFIKIPSIRVNGEVAVIDVMYKDKNEGILKFASKLVVNISDFKERNQYQRFLLYFEVKNNISEVQFRVTYSGEIPLFVDYVEIEPIEIF